MSVVVKSALIAAVLAFAINTAGVLVLLGTGVSYQWLLVWPLMSAVLEMDPIWLGLGLAYLVGFFQFFIPIWIIVAFLLRREVHG